MPRAMLKIYLVKVLLWSKAKRFANLRSKFGEQLYEPALVFFLVEPYIDILEYKQYDSDDEKLCDNYG